MKRKKFSDQERIVLLECPHALKVLNCNVEFTPEFKIFAVEQYYLGKSPLQIFLEANINLNLLGRKNAKRCLRRWLKKAKNFGKNSLLENNTGKAKGFGRPRSRFSSAEDEIKFLKAQNEYLKEENDFLKKLEALEREVM
jgi:transposase